LESKQSVSSLASSLPLHAAINSILSRTSSAYVHDIEVGCQILSSIPHSISWHQGFDSV